MQKAPNQSQKRTAEQCGVCYVADFDQVGNTTLVGPFIIMRINAKQRPITTPKNIRQEGYFPQKGLRNPLGLGSGRLFKTGANRKL